MERSTCCVVGGGPAGMVLGLLLARVGVEVTVFEKHGDFLLNFRRGTVHPSTLSLLDELGLAEEFEKPPRHRIDRGGVPIDSSGRIAALADFGALSTERLPATARVTNAPPWPRRIPAHLIDYGGIHEHPPKEALRRNGLASGVDRRRAHE